MTLPGFCQTGILPKTPSDSVVCIPKSMMISIIQDLTKGDNCEEENEILQQNISIQQNALLKKDTIISIYKTKSLMYQSTINDYEALDTENLKKISDLNRKVSSYKKKNKILGIASLVFLGVATGFIIK
mgnify:FL=1